MLRTPVNSTNVAAIGYDSSRQVLEVEFHGGRVYQYFDVPDVVFQQFLAAPSKGEFLNIIKGQYRYARA